jgi:protein-arginine deiminase
MIEYDTNVLNSIKSPWTLSRVAVAALGLVVASACTSSNRTAPLTSAEPITASTAVSAPAETTNATSNASPLVVDLRADLNHDGLVDVSPDGGADEAMEDDARPGAAIMLANLDDDAARCRQAVAALMAEGYVETQLDDCSDARDDVVNGAADELDLARLHVMGPSSADVTISVDPPSRARLFVQGAAGFVPMPADGTVRVEGVDGVELAIEALDIARDVSEWDGAVRVVAQSSTGRDEVIVRVAPVEITGNLGQIETLFVEGAAPPEREQAIDAAHFSDGSGDPADNQAFWRGFAVSDEEGQGRFVDNLQRQLADTGAADAMSVLSFDSWLWVWIQDLFEPASMTMPSRTGPHRLRTVLASGYHGIDSNGDGVLTGTEAPTAVLFRSLLGPDVAVVPSGVNIPGAQPGAENDRQYFLSAGGNIELLPPDDNNPLGRIAVGNSGDSTLFPKWLRLLESQQAQPVLALDTTWLYAGHVDEFMNTVPTQSARGWALVLADPRLGLELLRTAGPETEVFTTAEPQRVGDDVPGSQRTVSDGFIALQAPKKVGELLNDGDFVDANERSALAIDKNLAQIREAYDLTDAEIIRVPVLYKYTDGKRVAGYPRNTVNGLSAGSIFLAPMHHGPIVDGSDVLGAETERAFSAQGITVRWVDTSPLTPGGELHCATNVFRTLANRPLWWETIQ